MQHRVDQYKEWLEKYIGANKYKEWYEAWTEAATEEKKMEVAQKYGVAIFDWSKAGGSTAMSTGLAARKLQEQINSWGLKDVTVVGHSEGGIVVAKLLEMYAKGSVEKGQVKNMVLIDPPQTLWSPILGWTIPSVDASAVGVNVVFVPGQQACPHGGPPCGSAIDHEIIWQSFANNHAIRSEHAVRIYRALKVYNDAHAQEPSPIE